MVGLGLFPLVLLWSTVGWTASALTPLQQAELKTAQNTRLVLEKLYEALEEDAKFLAPDWLTGRWSETVEQKPGDGDLYLDACIESEMSAIAQAMGRIRERRPANYRIEKRRDSNVAGSPKESTRRRTAGGQSRRTRRGSRTHMSPPAYAPPPPETVDIEMTDAPASPPPASQPSENKKKAETPSSAVSKPKRDSNVEMTDAPPPAAESADKANSKRKKTPTVEDVQMRKKRSPGGAPPAAPPTSPVASGGSEADDEAKKQSQPQRKPSSGGGGGGTRRASSSTKKVRMPTSFSKTATSSHATSTRRSTTSVREGKKKEGKKSTPATGSTGMAPAEPAERPQSGPASYTPTNEAEAVALTRNCKTFFVLIHFVVEWASHFNFGLFDATQLEEFTRNSRDKFEIMYFSIYTNYMTAVVDKFVGACGAIDDAQRNFHFLQIAEEISSQNGFNLQRTFNENILLAPSRCHRRPHSDRPPVTHLKRKRSSARAQMFQRLLQRNKAVVPGFGTADFGIPPSTNIMKVFDLSTAQPRSPTTRRH